MMFSGAIAEAKSDVRHLATAGLLLLLVVNVMEIVRLSAFLKSMWEGMLHFDGVLSSFQ